MVTIDGVPRSGAPDLMGEFRLSSKTESISIGESERVLDLEDAQANPVIESLSLSVATDRLVDALRKLPTLAADLEHPSPEFAEQLGTRAESRWMLLLDHDEPFGLDERPHLAGPGGVPTAELTPDLALAPPLSEVLESIELDPLTVADDSGFLGLLQEEMNLPASIRAGLPDFY